MARRLFQDPQPEQMFHPNLPEYSEDSMLNNLKSADYDGFIKLGVEYADAVINAEEETDLSNLFDDNQKFETIEKDDNFTDSYYNLYNELVG